MLNGIPSALQAMCSAREQRRPMWTQHEKAVLRILMKQYAGVSEFDPPDIHKHPIKNEMWRLLTARYNSQPNVRTRDTKQLRKAWENLKYRARKICADRKNGVIRRDLPNDDESSWSLESILAGCFRDQIPLKRETGVEDMDPDGQAIENSESTQLDESSDVKSMRGFPLSVLDPSNTDRPAVFNIHPLISSLLGTAMPSLLPFLSSHPCDLSPPEQTTILDEDVEEPKTAANSPVTEEQEIECDVIDGQTQEPQEDDGEEVYPDTSKFSSLNLRFIQAKINQQEEEHKANMELIMVQKSQAEQQHLLKMKTLQVQLNFWQAKLKQTANSF